MCSPTSVVNVIFWGILVDFQQKSLGYFLGKKVNFRGLYMDLGW
jgi:hypothetical protein